MTNAKHIVAEINVHEHEGFYHLDSDELLGFHLCGRNLDALREALPAAVEFFFKHKFDQSVAVERAGTPAALTKAHPKTAAQAKSERVVMQPTFACA